MSFLRSMSVLEEARYLIAKKLCVSMQCRGVSLSTIN